MAGKYMRMDDHVRFPLGKLTPSRQQYCVARLISAQRLVFSSGNSRIFAILPNISTAAYAATITKTPKGIASHWQVLKEEYDHSQRTRASTNSTTIFCHRFIQNNNNQYQVNTFQTVIPPSPFSLLTALIYQSPHMSILSNSNYDQMVQLITRLRQSLNQQSTQEMQKYEMIGIKVKIIEQQILESQFALEKYQKDCSKKIEKFANETKNRMKDIREHGENKELEGDLMKEIKELQNCRDRLVRAVNTQNQLIAERLEREIDELQKTLEWKIKQRKERQQHVQQVFLKELEAVRTKLNEHAQQLNSQALIQRIQGIHTRLDKQMFDLRLKRKQKREKFLELLQTIILKCKQAND